MVAFQDAVCVLDHELSEDHLSFLQISLDQKLNPIQNCCHHLCPGIIEHFPCHNGRHWRAWRVGEEPVHVQIAQDLCCEILSFFI